MKTRHDSLQYIMGRDHSCSQNAENVFYPETDISVFGEPHSSTGKESNSCD